MSNNKMLIDATHPEETRVVVLRSGRVEEFDYESAARKLLRGNIYLAKVTRVEPSLQAAFVEYGGNRHGFLAFNEIHPDYYQIPMADRQALLDEEAAAEAREEAEVDAHAERLARRRRRGRRPRATHVPGKEEQPDLPGDAQFAKEGTQEPDQDGAAPAQTLPERAHNSDDVLTEELPPPPAPAAGPVEASQDSEASEDTASSSGQAEEDTSVAEATEAEAKSEDTPASDAPEAAAEDTDAETDEADPVEARAPSKDDDVDTDETDDEDDEDEDSDDDEDDDVEDSADDESADDDDDDSDDDANEDGDGEGEDGNIEVVARKTKASRSAADPVVQVGEEDALEELPERMRRRPRSYKIQEVIKRRQVILVQVVKEERGNKGAALTTYLSLAGRYTVLMPNTARGGGISRKITQPQDRKRLKAIAQELEVPEGMGLIIRTAGAARTKQEIKRDFEYLLRLWESVRELTLESTAPDLVYEEGNLIKRSIRDLYNKDVDEIVVAGGEAHKDARDFMRMLMPSHAKNVLLHNDPEPLFTRHGIERQLNAMFSPYVTLKSGGYLVINQTEALVAVDVNSGKSTREFSIEETALNTNLEAADELARQLKLRDLAGLVVIDFIDMEEKRNNRAVERRLKEALRFDRARIQLGRISHFGLMEMSRQRMRTGVLEGSTSQCPHCQGTGIIRSTESVALAVLRGLEDALMAGAKQSLIATTTATVALYLLNNKRPYINEMEARHGLTITIQASDKLQGANFTIEKGGPAPSGQRAPAKASSAVNMNWGFEDEDAGDATSGEDEVPARAEKDAQDGDAQPRRRRRRRRGRRGERDGEGSSRSEAQADNGEDASDELNDSETPQDASSEAGTESSGREGRRRRRGRRGGRRSRDRGERNAASAENGEGQEPADSNSDDTGPRANGASPSEPASDVSDSASDDAVLENQDGNRNGEKTAAPAETAADAKVSDGDGLNEPASEPETVDKADITPVPEEANASAAVAETDAPASARPPRRPLAEAGPPKLERIVVTPDANDGASASSGEGGDTSVIKRGWWQRR